jgi:hypothetical protein
MIPSGQAAGFMFRLRHDVAIDFDSDALGVKT